MSGLSLGFLVKGCRYLRAAILVGPLAGNVEPHGSRSLGGRNQSVCLAFIPFRSHLPDFDESEVWLSSAHSSGPHTWAQVLEICHFLLNVSGWGPWSCLKAPFGNSIAQTPLPCCYRQPTGMWRPRWCVSTEGGTFPAVSSPWLTSMQVSPSLSPGVMGLPPSVPALGFWPH